MSEEYLRNELMLRVCKLLAQEPDYTGIPDSRFNKRVSIHYGSTHLMIRGKRRGDIELSLHTPPDRPVVVLRHTYGKTRRFQAHVIEDFVLPVLRKHMVLLDMADV